MCVGCVRGPLLPTCPLCDEVSETVETNLSLASLSEAIYIVDNEAPRCGTRFSSCQHRVPQPVLLYLGCALLCSRCFTTNCHRFFTWLPHPSLAPCMMEVHVDSRYLACDFTLLCSVVDVCADCAEDEDIPEASKSEPASFACATCAAEAGKCTHHTVLCFLCAPVHSNHSFSFPWSNAVLFVLLMWCVRACRRRALPVRGSPPRAQAKASHHSGARV